MERLSSAKAEQPAPIARPKRHYDEKEISEMLATLRAINAIVDQKYSPALQILADKLHGWENRVAKNSANTDIEQIKAAGDNILSARNEVLALLKNASFYKDEFQTLAKAENDGNSSTNDALRRFITDVSELSRFQEIDGIKLVHFARPALNRLQSVVSQMQKWRTESKAIIQNKTVELREWKSG